MKKKPDKPKLGPCVACGGMVPQHSDNYRGHKKNCVLVKEWKKRDKKGEY